MLFSYVLISLIEIKSIKCIFNAFFNDFKWFYFAYLKIFSKLEHPNLLNLLTMKNIKRFVILITLVFVASLVFFSDFEISSSENNTTAIVSK